MKRLNEIDVKEFAKMVDVDDTIISELLKTACKYCKDVKGGIVSQVIKVCETKKVNIVADYVYANIFNDGARFYSGRGYSVELRG